MFIEEHLIKKTKWNEPVKVIKQGEEGPLLFLYHNDPTAGHLEERKVLDRLKRNLFWLNIEQDVKQHVQTYYRCQMQRGPDYTEPSFTLTPTAPWERVGIDFI